MNRVDSVPVALAGCPDYDDPERLKKTVDSIFQTLELKLPKGIKVLVKPNLLAPTPPDFLPCTNPDFTAAICAFLKESGARVRVGDSPSLGKAGDVARKIGLGDRLKRLGVEVIDLDRPVLTRGINGRRVFISREVLESDLVLNLPKLKTHHMSLITAVVKNLFGCVPGKIKAISHALLGFRKGRFEDMLLDLPSALPPCFHLLDGITAMQGPGPVRGKPYDLGLVAGSFSAVGLDTAVNLILGLNREEVPLWKRASQRGIIGSDPDSLAFPLALPRDFPAPGFDLPASLRRFGFFGPKKRVGGP